MGKLTNLWLALLASIFLGLVITFRTFISNNIILPVAVLLWAVWRYVLSVHQNIYWLLLIVLCLLLLIRYIQLPRRLAPRPAYDYRPDPVGRVDYWRTLVKTSLKKGDEESRLRDNLRDLVVSSLATSHKIDLRTAKERLITGQIPLPPRVQQFLFPSLETQAPATRGRSPQLMRVTDLLKWKRFLNPPADAPVDEVLLWIENFLEVNHDVPFDNRPVN